MSPVHDPRVRDDGLLELALGLRSTIDRFDRLLARFAGDDAYAGDRDREPGELTMMVLGLLALRDRIDRELARSVESPNILVEPAAVTLDGLLR